MRLESKIERIALKRKQIIKSSASVERELYARNEYTAYWGSASCSLKIERFLKSRLRISGYGALTPGALAIENF